MDTKQRDKGINWFDMATDIAARHGRLAYQHSLLKQQRDQAIALADQYRQLADYWCPDDVRLDELGDELRQLREACKDL